MAISSRRGSTLVELAIVMLLLGLLGSLLIPAIQKAKEKSQQSRCAYKLRRIINGVNKYEHSQGNYPPGRLLPDWVDANGHIVTNYSNYASIPPGDKVGNFSVHIWILPYVKAGHIFDLIDFSIGQHHKMLNPVNPHYEAYTQPMPLYLCPSDSNTGRGITENNYRSNFGGSTPYAGYALGIGGYSTTTESVDGFVAGGNGAFTMGEKGLKSSEYTDGLSKTAFFSERLKGSGGQGGIDPPDETTIVTSQPRHRSVGIPIDDIFSFCSNFNRETDGDTFNFFAAGRWPVGSDFSNGWPFAGYDATQYNHVAPPNWSGTDCGTNSSIPNVPDEHAIIAARSNHPRFVNVAFGDGHVKAIKDEIDLEVWRALGTRNNGETISEKKKRRRRHRRW